ncbi:MAG: lipopolysaccharide biosynthesis protein [Planctomycetota bacterium]
MDRSETSPSKDVFAADSLALGMAVVLAMTIIQRGLGFFRGLWFCRALDDSVVGQWSMAYDFITVITPVLMLGIPGTLPRYVEHYRGGGHLRQFVRQTASVTAALAAVMLAIMAFFPSWIGWWVFLEPSGLDTVMSVGLGVLAIVVFNYVYHLISSLRLIRIASWMQFTQSVGFTVLALITLFVGGRLNALIHCFTFATTLAVLPGWWVLRRGWKSLHVSGQPMPSSNLWRRVIPYMTALWMMNLLTNTFALSDRYMILHWMPGEPEQTQAAVGQYHSSRIIPMLFCSLASMISSVLMPYLTADFEAGRRIKMKRDLRLAIMGVAGLFTGGAAVTLWIAPWLFEGMLGGRYGQGLELMPMAYVACIWISTCTIGQDYLWVVERGKWVAFWVGIGLLINIALNAYWMPISGLFGAVSATLVANSVVSGGCLISMHLTGYRLRWVDLAGFLLPAALLISPTLALTASIACGLGMAESRRWAVRLWHEATRRLNRRAAAAC